MKKWLLAAISVIFIVGLSSCGESTTQEQVQDTIEQIKQRGVVRIGVFGDKPPFGFVNKDGKNDGFDVYIAKRIAKDLLGDENKVEFILTEAASRVEKE